MAETTGIGWTDHTFNFWRGCTRVSEECRFCYIDALMRRAGKVPFGGPIRTMHWEPPDAWNRKAIRDGVRRRVFTCSMSDFFHVGADPWRDEAWDIIRRCDALDWLILTKRPERILACLPSDWASGYPNVWLGTTCGYDWSLKNVEELLRVPAHIRFVSAEPLLAPLDFSPYLSGLDWVITGCEQAGKDKRRVMEMDWVRAIDRQCRDAGVAHFFKQYYVDEQGWPCTDGMLDGVQRQEFPRSNALAI